MIVKPICRILKSLKYAVPAAVFLSSVPCPGTIHAQASVVECWQTKLLWPVVLVRARLCPVDCSLAL